MNHPRSIIYTSIYTQLVSILSRIRDRKILHGPRKLVKRGAPMELSYESLNRACKNVKNSKRETKVNYLFEVFFESFSIFNISLKF